MAHFQILFKDTANGVQITHFDEFTEAQKFWDTYADLPTCVGGELLDLDDGEIVWEFGEKF